MSIGPAQNQFALLSTKRFLPLFVVQALGAFNDNLFKTALVVLITYRFIPLGNLPVELLVSAAAGVFILPFFLFSSLAGQLADRHEKARLIRLLKLVEIGVMGLAAAGFLLKSLPLLFLTLFLMGTQSTFFGPLKFGILPNLLHSHELVAGNGLVSAATFIAILVGTIAGSLVIMHSEAALIAIAGVLTIAIGGYLSSRSIPTTIPSNPKLKINANFFMESVRLISMAKRDETLFRAVLGISWFWFLGSSFYVLLPIVSKDIVGGDGQIVALFLTAFSVGFALGAMLCNRLARGARMGALVPLGALGMVLAGLDFYFATGGDLIGSRDTLIGLSGYFTSAANVRIFLDLLLMAACGGLYVVPLYTSVQRRARDEERARMFAVVNIINAFGMVLSSLFIAFLTSQNLGVRGILLAITLISIPFVLFIARVIVKGAVMGLLKRIQTLS